MTSDAERRQRRSSAEQRRHDVHMLLAAADPGDPDDSNRWSRYEELHADIGPSDVVGCSDERARRLIINLIRYLYASGDLPAAMHLADTALHRWSTGDSQDQAGHVRLQRLRTGLLLAGGQYHAADRARQAALSQMSLDPVRWRDEIVIMSRHEGVLLRAQGRFEQALAASKLSFEEHAASQLGRDHPQTLHAANELVTGYALACDLRSATDLAERTLRDCRVLCDRPGHPHPLILSQQNALARCLRLTGNYQAAWDAAREVHAGYARLAESGLLGDGQPRYLEHEIDYAAARRDLGAGENCLTELAARLQQVHQRCWQALSVDHPLTLAAAVTRGSILRLIPGRVREAEREAADAERRYRSALPGHPYGLASQVLLASIRRQLGHPPGAVIALTTAADGLRTATGASHACTLVADVALMNALADAGELPAALARGRQALARFTASLGAAHPQTLSCAANLSLVSAQAQEPDAARLVTDAVARLRAALGPDHPAVKTLQSGKPFDLDFTPLPL